MTDYTGRRREAAGRMARRSGRLVVIDLETTGLRRADRIVEFAAIVLADDGDGALAARSLLETLVDSGRGPGPAQVHGITPEMLGGAPSFADIARTLYFVLNGAVLVGHNLAFDWGVLRSEFGRLGLRLPRNAGGICTARLAGSVFGHPVSLQEACRSANIEQSRPHTAAGDAHATAALYHYLASRVGEQVGGRRLLLPSRLGLLPPSRRLVPRHEREPGLSFRPQAGVQP